MPYLCLLHTRKKRTDWLNFCTELNLRVLIVWQQAKTLCNIYVKSAEHMQLHNKEIVLQASQAEVMHTTCTIVACQLKNLFLSATFAGAATKG